MSRFTRKILRSLVIPVLATAAFVSLALVFVYQETYSREEGNASATIGRAADSVTAELRVSLASLNGLRAFRENSEVVEDHEFSGYAEVALDAAPLLTGVGLIDQNGLLTHSYGSYSAAASSKGEIAREAQMARAVGVVRWKNAPQYLLARTNSSVTLDILVPTFREGSFTGAVIGSLDVESLENDVIRPVLPPRADFALRLGELEYIKSERWSEPDFWLFKAFPGRIVERNHSLDGVSGEWELYVVYRSYATIAASLVLAFLAILLVLLVGPLVRQAYTDRRDLEAYAEREREFIALVTHQLRQPLTGIKWSLESLAGRAAKRLRPDFEELIDVINNSAKFISELSSISRLERGVLKNIPEEVGMHEVVSGIIKPFEGQVRAGKLILEEKAGNVALFLDKTKVMEAVRNIVDNAIKYGGSKAVLVRTDIDVAADMAVIYVNDRGDGIPADQLPFIFEKAGSASKKRLSDTGAGIGLHLSKRFIELIGGELSVKSAPGDTVFTIRLPLMRTGYGK